MTLNEQELVLIKKARRGRTTALAALLAMRTDYLYRTAYLYVGNEQDALEVIQEATAQAVAGIHQLRQPEFFWTWFTRLLIRQAQVVYSRRASEEPRDTLPEEAVMDDRIAHLDLLAAMTKLKAEYRQVLTLFYYQDMPITAISQTLSLPEATVKTRLKRGREAMKTILGGAYDA